MASKPKFKPNIPRKILLEALSHPEFLNDLPLLTFENNQLLGTIVVHEVDRMSLLTSAFENYNKIEYKGEEPVVVFMTPNRFCHKDDGQKFNFKLGYSVDWNKEKFDGMVDECLSSTLVLKVGHKTIGFFMFVIELSQFNDKEIIFKIELKYIYVNKKNRNKVNWLNLTTALTKFLTVVLDSLIQIVNEKQKLDLAMEATFVSTGGEKIGNGIYNEINFVWEFLQDTYPEKQKCFGNFSYEMD